MSRDIGYLVDAREKAVKSLQAFSKEAGTGNMDADLAAKFNAAREHFYNLCDRIKLDEDIDAIDSNFAPVAKPAEIDAFNNFMKTGNLVGLKISNDMSTAAASAGAIVPTDLYNTIIKAQYDVGAMLGLASIINVSGGATDIPVSATASTAYWTAEAAALTASDITLGTVTLTPKKLTSLVKVSIELLADSAFDVASYVGQDTGTQMGRSIEDALINATATGLPRGVAVSASFALTSSVTASFAYTDLVGLYTSVKSPYRRQGSWLISDSALLKVMLLTDGDGRFVFQPSYSEGTPDKLLSKPMKTSEYMPAVTTGVKPILFGDFKYYKVARKTDISMQRLNELYAGNQQVGFMSTTRLDGGLTLADAIKYMAIK